MKLKYFPWLIGLFLLVVIVLASFPAPSLIQLEASETENKVTYNAPFTMHFSQVMDRDSVERAFQLVPETKGSFNWKGFKTLEFYPKEDLSIGDRYRIVIGSEAKSIWMKKLGYDAVAEYLVTGPPFVMFADPDENSILKKDGVITVMFDRAMDFSDIDEDDLVKVEPELDGDIRLVGMSAFQLIPEKLSTEKKYQFTIPAGLVALDGGVTAEDYSWEVSTPSLKVEQSSPTDETAAVKLDEPLQIVFNDEAPLDAIKPGINALLYPSNDLDADVNPKMDGFFNTEVTYATDEAGDSRKDIFVFAPTFPYQPDTEYRFVLKADSNLHLEEDFEINFKTLEAAAVDETEKEDEADIAEEVVTTDEDSLWKSADLTYFIRGEHPRLQLKEALSESAMLEACQVSSNEFMRISAKRDWDDYHCEERGVTVTPVQKDDGLTINLNDYFDYEWVTGVYYTSLTQGEKKYNKLFLIEDSTLLLKRSDQDLFVWALDTKSGDPIPEMQLEILDYQGELIAEGETDETGVFTIHKAFDQGIYVRGKKEGDLNRWAFVSDQWLLGSANNSSGNNDAELYIILNQQEFFPGDHLQIKGVWRRSDKHLLSFPEATQVTVTIEDYSGNFIFSKRVPLRRNGSFDASIDLSEEITEGSYFVAVSDLNHQELTDSIPIVIKKGVSDFKLDWVEAQKHYPAHSTPVLIAKARYQNGLPAAQLKARYDLYREPYALSYEKGAVQYVFGGGASLCTSDCERTLVVSDTFDFDLDGEAKLFMTDGEGFLSAGYRYYLVVSDVSGGVNLLHSFEVHSGTYDLGLGLKHRIIDAEQAIEGSVTTLNYEGKIIPDKKVKVSLLSADGQEKKISESVLTTELQPVNFTIPVTPEMEDGQYLIRAESLDDKHDSLISEAIVTVSTNPLLPIGKELMLLADQNKYFLGGRAHLLINEPDATEDEPVPVVVTYERDGLLTHEAFMLTMPVTRISVPIEDQMPPYFVATVSRFNRGVQPSFDFASERIDVGNDASKIFVDVSYSPLHPKPGDELTLSLHTYDYQNRSIPAVVTLNVLNQPPESVDFSYRSFFPALLKPLAAASNISLQVREFLPPFERVINSITSPIRSIYFDPLVTTDNSGKAELMLTLPETRQDIYVQAFATRDQGQFGVTTRAIMMNDQLSIKPILPSFVVPGDQTVFSALVKNISDQPIQSRLALVSPDTPLKGDSSRNFSLKPGQQAEISFNVFVDTLIDKDSLELSFESDDNLLKVNLPVKRAKVKTKVPGGGLLSDIWTGRIPTLKEHYTNIGRLELFLSGSPIVAGKVQADSLNSLPQTSTFTLASKLISVLTLPEQKDLEEKDALLSAKTLTSLLLKRADSSGAYRFWNEASPNPVLTSMILFSYKEAMDRGVHVDSLQLNKTIAYLWGVFDRGMTLSAEDELLILWVLGLNEQYDTERALDYFQMREELSPQGQAFLLMNLNQLIQAGQKSATPLFETLKAELLDKAVEEDNKLHFEASPETTAVMLYTLNNLDPSNPLLKPMADYLASASGSGFSPKEALWILVSLSRYVESFKADNLNFIAQVKLNGDLVMDQSVTSQTVNEVYKVQVDLSKLDHDKEVNDLFVKKEGSGSLYFDAYLTSYLDPSKSTATEEGLIVLRRLYELTDDGQRLPVSTLKKGHYYLSEIELVVPKDYHYLSLTDTLPAGMRVADAESDDFFTEYMSNVDGVTYYAPYLKAGVYKIETKLQAILPGTYMRLPAKAQPMFEPDVLGSTEGETIQIID